MVHALRTANRRDVHEGAVQKHHARVQSRGLEYIAGAAYAAVDHHGRAVAHVVHH